MDSGQPVEPNTEDLNSQISVNINSPENHITVVKGDNFDIDVNVNLGARSDVTALAQEAREIGKAIASALAATRGEAA